jgi:hypothetical protein
MCGICGRPKKEGALMCVLCNTQWRKEAPLLIAQGTPMDIWEWTEARLNAVLAEIRSALELKQKEVQQLSDEVDRETEQQLAEKLGGKKFDEGILRDARAQIRRPIWQSHGGNRLYRELMQLKEGMQPRIEIAEAMLLDIAHKKRGAEQRVQDQRVAALIESVFPLE